MKFRYRCATGGFKDAGKDPMDEAGETSSEHSHPKIRSLKKVL
jgi:hypothetical protein